MRYLRCALMPIVVARLDVALDALLALLGMLGIAFLGVDATRRRHLLDAGSNANAHADTDTTRRARRCRCGRRRCLIALFIYEAAQEALVNRFRRCL